MSVVSTEQDRRHTPRRHDRIHSRWTQVVPVLPAASRSAALRQRRYWNNAATFIVAGLMAALFLYLLAR